MLSLLQTQNNPTPQIGILAFTLDLRMVYMNRPAADLCRLLEPRHKGDMSEDLLPMTVRVLCQQFMEMIQADIYNWRDIHLQHLISQVHTVLLRAFGLPDTSGRKPAFIVVLMEEKDEPQLGGIRDAQDKYRLTTREVTIMEHVFCGLSSKEIGTRLGISYETVNSHIKHIRVKTHTNSRTGALARLLGVTDHETIAGVKADFDESLLCGVSASSH